MKQFHLNVWSFVQQILKGVNKLNISKDFSKLQYYFSNFFPLYLHQRYTRPEGY